MSSSIQREISVVLKTKENYLHPDVVAHHYDYLKHALPDRIFLLIEWLDILNILFGKPGIAIYQSCIEAVLELIHDNSTFHSQTEFECKTATQILENIIGYKKELLIDKSEIAQKLLMLSVILAKYPGMQMRSLPVCLKQLSLTPTKEEFNRVFLHLFTKYEPIQFLSNHYNLLDVDDLRLLMEALSGKKTSHLLKSTKGLTRAEMRRLLYHLSEQCVFDNHVLTRGIILAKIGNNENTGRVYHMLDDSNTFRAYPNEFLKDITFWKSGFLLILNLDDNPNFDASFYIDFLENIRLENPSFSLKGRTSRSFARLVSMWHFQIHRRDFTDYKVMSWPSSGLPDKTFEYKQYQFAFVELVNGYQLDNEGKSLQHCVLTYAPSCELGYSKIWSMRQLVNDGVKRLITIEVRNNIVVQALGLCNRRPTSLENYIIRKWAHELKFQINLSIFQVD